MQETNEEQLIYFEIKFNNNSNNILISNQMIPSSDAHKVCKMRNNKSHIRLKKFSNVIILFALISLLQLNIVAYA